MNVDNNPCLLQIAGRLGCLSNLEAVPVCFEDMLHLEA